MFTKILHRPALAIVISVLILFLGGLAINTLPISQFPSVAPPSVVVAVSYPGASAEVLVDSVLIILEQAINGVQDMRYMASAATSAGEATIQIIFEPGTDPNVAVVNVNNRIQIVKNRLPPIVEREGIIVMQIMTSMLMYVNIYSTDKGLDQNFLYNYATVNILPEIKRTRGMGTRQYSRQPRVCHADLAESRPHARLQGVRRRRHEGGGGTEHDRFARTTRPGDGQDVAIRRVRPDLGGALQQAGAV